MAIKVCVNTATAESMGGKHVPQERARAGRICARVAIFCSCNRATMVGKLASHSKTVKPVPVLGSLCATSHILYMSPAVILLASLFSPRLDRWNFGMVN